MQSVLKAPLLMGTEHLVLQWLFHVLPEALWKGGADCSIQDGLQWTEVVHHPLLVFSRLTKEQHPKDLELERRNSSQRKGEQGDGTLMGPLKSSWEGLLLLSQDWPTGAFKCNKSICSIAENLEDTMGFLKIFCIFILHMNSTLDSTIPNSGSR